MTKSMSLTAQAQELKSSLADHLRAGGWVTFTEMPLGSVFEHDGRLPRADVLAFKKSYTKPSVTIFEVKVTKQDLVRDIDDAKYEKYLPFCQRFSYATPQGLATVGDIPKSCGLIVQGANGWHTPKASPLSRAFHWDMDLLLACFFRGYQDFSEGKRREERLRSLQLHKPLTRRRAREFGEELGLIMANPSYDMIEAEKLKKRLEEYLGEETRSLSQAINKVEAKVKKRIAVAENVDLVLDMAQLACSLIHGEGWIGPQAKRVGDILLVRALPKAG